MVRRVVARKEKAGRAARDPGCGDRRRESGCAVYRRRESPVWRTGIPIRTPPRGGPARWWSRWSRESQRWLRAGPARTASATGAAERRSVPPPAGPRPLDRGIQTRDAGSGIRYEHSRPTKLRATRDLGMRGQTARKSVRRLPQEGKAHLRDRYSRPHCGRARPGQQPPPGSRSGP